jgi:hypothetical protein
VIAIRAVERMRLIMFSPRARMDPQNSEMN